MNRKQLRRALAHHLVDNCVVGSDIVQKQPYTLVSATFEFLGESYSDYAFAKVQWPDEWDSVEGVELCTYRCAKTAARNIMDKVDHDAILTEVAAADPLIMLSESLTTALNDAAERIQKLVTRVGLGKSVEQQIYDALESNHPGVGFLRPLHPIVTLEQIRAELASDETPQSPSPGISA